MREALRALNQLVDDGVIAAYAIGGAVGASFYIEAMQTEDVDAFVFLPDSSSGLVLLTPIYEALSRLGGVVEREYVRFGAWPLQILTDATPLITEAIRRALHVQFDGIPTRVFRPEHLCAIALQTGRTKDYLRVSMFLEQDAVERDKLTDVVGRYGLTEQMARVQAMEPGR
jgi:hypothetical protein